MGVRTLQSWDRPASPTQCYQHAAVHARLGDADIAIEWLDRAVEEGFRRPAAAPRDPDFASLDDDPRYEYQDSGASLALTNGFTIKK